MTHFHSSRSTTLGTHERRWGLVGCLVLAGSVVACGGEANGGDVPQDDPMDFEACPQVSTTTLLGHSVQVCEALHEEAPFVRPPADTDSAAYVATDGERVYVRGEEPRALVASERALLGIDDDIAGGPAQKLSGFVIYRARFDGGRKITSAAPAILIDDTLMLSFLVGKSAEGLISRHVSRDEGSFQYETEPSLPIRLRFNGLVDTGETLGGGTIVRSGLSVVVENLSDSVGSASGTCLPAMTAAGAENPFEGLDPLKLVGTRVPAMHSPGENQLVIDGVAGMNHMSPAWMVMPHQLLGTAPITFERATFMPHGSFTAMPQLELGLVEGDAASCGDATKSPRP